MKNALDVILQRSSVRSYTSEPVSTDDINTLLRAGMAAPSAKNEQAWRFVAVTERAMLDKLAATNRHAAMLLSAPLAIVVCGETERELHGEIIPNVYWDQDCAAATENILLAVEHLGLGAVWTGCHPRPERIAPVRELLGLPATVAPFCIIVIGHPSCAPSPKDKWDPAKVHWQKW